MPLTRIYAGQGHIDPESRGDRFRTATAVCGRNPLWHNDFSVPSNGEARLRYLIRYAARDARCPVLQVVVTDSLSRLEAWVRRRHAGEVVRP